MASEVRAVQTSLRAGREDRGSPGEHNCMGDKADDILRSFKLSEADAKVYSEVKSKFERHFVKRRNVIFERAKFKTRTRRNRGRVYRRSVCAC